ncbi:11180_t:CDS:1 [Cetraspora pellucida]|uniref:11180_t:CDS:1 n=1 Tax=Cetraspora pellucida TaxID=1433469 RepID=A0ACA9LQT1_9GLOM|nr:11180_t:CDS:1 [Cetraspora pellucida]
MSKLRAAITWEHSQKLDPSELLPPDFSEESTDSLENMSYERHEFDNKPAKSCEIRPESEEFEDLTIDKDFNNELDSDFLKERFGEFLDVWVEISANEVDTEEDEDYKIPSKIEDIIHPAIDPVAKWDLKLLFNELQLP